MLDIDFGVENQWILLIVEMGTHIFPKNIFNLLFVAVFLTLIDSITISNIDLVIFTVMMEGLRGQVQYQHHGAKDNGDRAFQY